MLTFKLRMRKNEKVDLCVLCWFVTVPINNLDAEQCNTLMGKLKVMMVTMLQYYQKEE